MVLEKLLMDFNNLKDQIRQKTPFKVPSSDEFDGLTMAISYSEIMEHVVKSLFTLTAESMEKSDYQGIGAFLYGSLGRREMVSESDLDLMLVYQDNSSRYLEFKDRLKTLVKPFEFCKIDLPDWGTLDDASIYAQKSITEGNQILECRFICGDEQINKQVKSIQDTFGSPDRMIRNIVFQKFYFDQYFKQRIRDGAINVKYCDGGSRDFLFLYWFNTLMTKKYPEWNKIHTERPVAELGLSNLYKNGIMSSLDFGRSIEALQFNILLRNEILINNKGGKDEGLTFLDSKTLNAVYERMPELMKKYNIKSGEELRLEFNKQRKQIYNIKNRIWDLMINERSKELGNNNWASDFRKAYSTETSESERYSLFHHDDILIRIGLIWGASNSGQSKLLDKMMEREKDTLSWEVQASLTTSPCCTSEYLHHISTKIGKEKGYGYILRIVSRNPNVSTETLKTIVEDPILEYRYKQIAEASLKYGRNSANHQI